MQNKTSITDNYNKINKNNKFSKKFVYCIVKTLLGNTYKCKILYETPKQFVLIGLMEKDIFLLKLYCQMNFQL